MRHWSFCPSSRHAVCGEPAGSVALTCYLLSLLRLIEPSLLLPATTALGTLDKHGCERGMLAGANVVMPNLSPMDVRKKYELYDNKAHAGSEAAEGLAELRRSMGRSAAGWWSIAATLSVARKGVGQSPRDADTSEGRATARPQRGGFNGDVRPQVPLCRGLHQRRGNSRDA